MYAFGSVGACAFADMLDLQNIMLNDVECMNSFFDAQFVGRKAC